MLLIDFLYSSIFIAKQNAASPMDAKHVGLYTVPSKKGH